MFSFDLATRRVVRLPVALNSDYDYVSGAAVCDDDTYYAIYAEIETGAIGLARVANVSTPAPLVRYLSAPSLLHGVWCDPRQPGQLLVVRSDPGDPQAVFHVARYDPSAQTSADIAPLPAAWAWSEDDAVFAFDPVGYRVWASGPVTKGLFENSGAIYAVDVGGNAAVATYALGYEAGWLGYAHPTSTTTGFGYRQTDEGGDLRWASFTLRAGTVTHTDGADVTATLWSAGQPLAACDDAVVAAALPSNNLTVADARTGETIWALALADLGVPAPNAGALVALCG